MLLSRSACGVSSGEGTARPAVRPSQCRESASSESSGPTGTPRRSQQAGHITSSGASALMIWQAWQTRHSIMAATRTSRAPIHPATSAPSTAPRPEQL